MHLHSASIIAVTHTSNLCILAGYVILGLVLILGFKKNTNVELGKKKAILGTSR